MKNNGDEILQTVEIDASGLAKNSIIWLHGLGADGYDFVPIVNEFNFPKDLGVRFVFPHAKVSPVTLNNGYEMRSWFDIVSLSTGGMLDKKGVLASVSEVNKLIEREKVRGVPAHKIIVAGFSQGGVVAQYAGLMYGEKIAGIIGLSTCLPGMAELVSTIPEANKHTPMFLAHGTMDPILPFSFGDESAKALINAGYNVTWKTYPIAHTVSNEETRDIKDWLLQIMDSG